MHQLVIKLTRDHQKIPLAEIKNFPGGDAELRPVETRSLAAALLQAVTAYKVRPMKDREFRAIIKSYGWWSVAHIHERYTVTAHHAAPNYIKKIVKLNSLKLIKKQLKCYRTGQNFAPFLHQSIHKPYIITGSIPVGRTNARINALHQTIYLLEEPNVTSSSAISLTPMASISSASG